jgi:hypothetical protein
MIGQRLAITLVSILGCLPFNATQAFSQEAPPPGIEKELPKRSPYSPYCLSKMSTNIEVRWGLDKST